MTDFAGRTAISMGATLAGLAFSNAGITVVHALEYSPGGRYGLAHGAGNGNLLPSFMRFVAAEPYCFLVKLSQQIPRGW